MVGRSWSVESLRRRRTLITAALLILLIIALGSQQQSRDGNYSTEASKGLKEPKNKALFSAVSSTYQSHRKLLVADETQKSANKEETNRIWGDKCSTSDIVINQGPTEPLPSGIPTWTVEIMNACVTGCDISGIHLTCGWFASARLINPRIFKRLGFNDCLVNGGQPLANGKTISFQYANSYPYSLSVAAVNC